MSMPLTWSMVVVFFSMSPLMCTIHSKYGSFRILFKWNETYQSQSRMLCRCCCYCRCCWWHELKITKSCISIAIIRHWFPNNQTNYHDSQRAKIIIQCIIIPGVIWLKCTCNLLNTVYGWYFSLLISFISLLNAVNFCSYPGWQCVFFPWNSNIAKCHYHPSIL